MHQFKEILLSLAAFAALTFTVSAYDLMRLKEAAFEVLLHSPSRLAERELFRNNSKFGPCVRGLAHNTFPCKNVDMVGYLSIEEMGGSSNTEGTDIWGWTDPLTHKEYAIVCMTHGFSIVDISDDNNIEALFWVPRPPNSRPSSWGDAKVYKNTVYAVADITRNYGVQIFDLTRVRNPPTARPATVTADSAFRGFHSAHNIFINEESGFAYACGSERCRGGLIILDLNKNKTNPTEVACVPDDGYVHDLQCVNYDGPDRRYLGREICFGYDKTHIALFDVTNKSNIKIISRTNYPEVGYTHQGWLTEDQNFIVTNDELDEIDFSYNRPRSLIFDVRDLENPLLVSQEFAEATAIDHNLYIKSDQVYMSNYGSGLRIHSIKGLSENNRTDFTELGYFDVQPGPNLVGFSGAWSSYPYFESGKIIVSSIETGLFVLRYTGAE